MTPLHSGHTASLLVSWHRRRTSLPPNTFATRLLLTSDHHRFPVEPRGIPSRRIAPRLLRPVRGPAPSLPGLLPSLPPHPRIVSLVPPRTPNQVKEPNTSPCSLHRPVVACQLHARGFLLPSRRQVSSWLHLERSQNQTAAQPRFAFAPKTYPLFLPLTSSSPVFKSLQPQSRPHHVLCLHCQPPQPPSSHLSHLPSTTWDSTKRKALARVDAHVYRSSAAAPEREKRIPLEFHTSSRTSARPLFTTLARAVAPPVRSLHAHCRENSIPPTSSLHQHVFLWKSTECR